MTDNAPQKSEYEQVYDGEWWTIDKEILLQCCSCGLVHVVKFRLHEGQVQVQFTVDNRRTGQVRRWRKLKEGKRRD